MSEQGTRAVAAVARLRASLERTAGALARPDLDTLLAGESEIEVALAELHLDVERGLPPSLKLRRTAEALAEAGQPSRPDGRAGSSLRSAGLNELSPEERRAVRVEVDGAHAALLRCRRLGAALASFVRISLEAQGRSEYGPRKSASSYAGQALDARV